MGDAFQAGIDALTRLTKGKIHLNISADATASKVFTNSKNVRVNKFSGKHPAGNVGTQIAHIDPINKGDIVWYLRPQEVLHIGRLFLKGRVDATRLVALTGSEVKRPHYFKTSLGSSIEKMVDGNTNSGKLRYISGNRFNRQANRTDGYVGFYDSQVLSCRKAIIMSSLAGPCPDLINSASPIHISPGSGPAQNSGWIPTLTAATGLIVMTGQFEKVFGWDIYPLQLIKAIMIEDIDLMEKLGIYEVDEEDFALCEFIDTSKTEIQSIVRKGLDLMRKEMS